MKFALGYVSGGLVGVRAFRSAGVYCGRHVVIHVPACHGTIAVVKRGDQSGVDPRIRTTIGRAPIYVIADNNRGTRLPGKLHGITGQRRSGKVDSAYAGIRDCDRLLLRTERVAGMAGSNHVTPLGRPENVQLPELSQEVVVAIFPLNVTVVPLPSTAGVTIPEML